ncbi:bacterial Ig-like domain protein [Histomonas meleagridis]|uniref:bacterial Ig-like domain protein n=1 Tax=Histomonas meleagridis TaxID=135588 RepID=UPI003559E47A|nr:bacterial Ig-like domain protein [Histomonas meleagridis]KAH0797779.1 bacterial Ig-like domain protein [Histomonas meleagridis]
MKMSSDTTSRLYVASQVFRLWLEGGVLDTNVPQKFSPLLDGKVHVEQYNFDTFNHLTLEDLKGYDIIVFGMWEYNGYLTLADHEINSLVIPYIEMCNGVLLCNNAISSVFQGKGFNLIQEKFGLKVDRPATSQYNQITPNIDGITSTYPYEIQLSENSYIFTQQWISEGKVTDGDLWYKADKNDETFYLVTKDNTAIIQMGSFEMNVNEIELKILANTLTYLIQKTTDENFIDLTAVDANPPDVKVDCYSKPYHVTWEGVDKGTEYTYKVVAHDEAGKNIAETKEKTINVITDIKEYLYIIDSVENTEITEYLKKYKVTTKKEIPLNKFDFGRYFHICPVDNAGNFGKTQTCAIPPIPTQSPNINESISNISINSEGKKISKVTTAVLFIAIALIVLCAVIALIFIISHKKKVDILNKFEKEDVAPLFDKNEKDPFENDKQEN